MCFYVYVFGRNVRALRLFKIGKMNKANTPTMKIKGKHFDHKAGAYAFAGESVYKDGELCGNITHHDRENKTISFTMVSDNQFMNGVKSSLNYQ